MVITPKKASSVVFGGSALFALMIALAARTDVPQTVATTVSVGQGDQFNDAWNESTGPVLLKAASLASTEPKPVKTVAVTPDIEPDVVVIKEEKITTKPKQHHVERDVCQRHGMHKVITRGGRSWRCRR